jgi:protein SCO1/2
MFTRRKLLVWTIAMAVGAFTAGHVASLMWERTASTDGPGVQKAGKRTTEFTLGGDFSLIDHTGRPVTIGDFKPPFRLIFFGYTYCPDVCPTELQRISLLLDGLGPLAERVQPIFISIDPERDTEAVLKNYVGNFHPRLVGLTGSKAQLRAAAKKFGVYFGKMFPMPTPGEGDSDSDAEYLMNHSSLIFLTGAKGRVRDIYQRDVRLKFMIERVRNVIGDEDKRKQDT